MTHADAVRIALGGEGAIVSELLRLSGRLEQAEAHVKKLQEDVATYGDRAALIPELLAALRTLLFACRDGAVFPRDCAHKQALSAIAKAEAMP